MKCAPWAKRWVAQGSTHAPSFPGPGLGVRVVGEIKPKHLRVLREADAIFIEELFESGWYHKLWQAFCVFLPVRSVGVMGDERTYENVISLRAVTSSDAMTADWAQSARQAFEESFESNHQRSQRSQPSGLRYQLQASKHDRVGVVQRHLHEAFLSFGFS